VCAIIFNQRGLPGVGGKWATGLWDKDMAPEYAKVTNLKLVLERLVEVTQIKRFALVCGPKVLKGVDLEGYIIRLMLWASRT